MMGELSLWRRVILIGLAFVLAAGGLVLPWGVHQLAGRLPDGSWRRSLTFSTEFVPKSGHFAFDWTDFSQSFVWRGDLYFVETVSPVDYLNATYVIFADLPSSHRPARRVMAWNLATRRARVVAACREQMMYFVHDDRLVVLNLPTTRSDVVWRNSLAQKRVFKWRFVGPFDFQCRPSVLAIDDGNLSPPLSWQRSLTPGGGYRKGH